MNGLVNVYNSFTKVVTDCIPPPSLKKIKENVFVDAEKLEALDKAGIYSLPESIFKQQKYVIGQRVIYIGSSMYLFTSENNVSYLLITLEEFIKYLKKKFNANFIIRPFMNNHQYTFIHIHMVV